MPACPADCHGQPQSQEGVSEGDADSEAQGHLPSGDCPASQDPAGASAPGLVALAECESVAPRQHGQGQRDAAGGEDVHVPAVRQAPRCVSEGEPSHQSPRHASAQLPVQGVRAKKGQSMQKNEKNIIADDCCNCTRTDHAEGRITQQAVRKRQARLLREEGVGIPHVGRGSGQ